MRGIRTLLLQLKQGILTLAEGFAHKCSELDLVTPSRYLALVMGLVDY